MIRMSICSIMLLCPIPCMAVTLESDVLQFIDGTILTWDAVATTKKYQHRLRHFINTKRPVGTAELNIWDLGVMEKKGLLTDVERAVFEAIIQEFGTFSEPFLETLNPVKQGLAPVMQEFCIKRNRQQSLLLVWLDTVVGTEEAMFRIHIKTYRALAELCVDLLNFSEDLLSSCPKAIHAYHAFFDRVKKIEPFIDALLVADRIVISHSGVLYHELLKYVAEHYLVDETITAEKTAQLYHAYNIKKRL